MLGEKLFSEKTDTTVIYKENGPAILLMFLTVFTSLGWLLANFSNLVIGMGGATVFLVAVTYMLFLVFTFIGYMFKYYAPSLPGAVIDLGDPKRTWVNVGLGAGVGALLTVTFFATVKTGLVPVVSSAIMLVVVCLVGPLIEELFFHGWVLPTVGEYSNKLIACIITNLAFAFYHMGTWGSISVFGFLVPFIFGILLSILTFKLESIAPAIIAHMTANTLLNLSAAMFPALVLILGGH